MSHVTPEQARELAGAIMVTAKFNEAGHIIVDTLRSLAAQLEAAQSRSVRAEWVPCSERMPDYGAEVLGYFPHSAAVVQTYRVGHCRPSDTHKGMPMPDHWWTRIGDYHMDACTHWQPLPPAPIPSTPDPGQFSPGPTP